ncbi:MAG TPA: hypothetical protein PKK30_15365 [Nitrospira sp.]|nr:hypothetical protein [Nitrospira sp.]HNO35701.1 hypothetical protein [Nitrospira sp.]
MANPAIDPHSFVEARTDKPNTLDGSTGKVGLLQIAVIQDRPIEQRPTHVAMLQVGADHVAPGKIGTTQAGIGKVRALKERFR